MDIPKIVKKTTSGQPEEWGRGGSSASHRVVDAMNVIGSRPDGWWRDRAGAIERLVGQLDRWAESRPERVTVVLEHEPREPLTAERVEIAWASAGGADAADREILARLGGWLAEGEVVVVTSDRDLATKARAAGAAVAPSRPFRAELDREFGPDVRP